MSIRYAIQNGNWSNTAIWSETYNGAGGASVPTTGDIAYANGYTVTIDTNATCLEIRNDNLGPELVTNGTFDSQTGWTTTGTKLVISGGQAVATASVYNTDYIQGNLSSISTSNTYKATLSCTVTAGHFNLDRPGVGSIFGSVSTSGDKVVYFVPTVNNNLPIRLTGTTFTGTVDNISIKQVMGGYFSLENGVTLTANVYGGPQHCLVRNGSSTSTIAGSVYGGSLNPGSSDIAGLNITAGDVTINGNLTGGSATYCHGVLINSSTSTLTVTGNLSGGTIANTPALRVNSGNAIINGNITGTASQVVRFLGTNLTISNSTITGGYGNVCYGLSLESGTSNITATVNGGSNATAYGIQTSNAAIVNISGNCTGATSVGLYHNSSSTVTITNTTLTQSTTKEAVYNNSTGTINFVTPVLIPRRNSSAVLPITNASTGIIQVNGATAWRTILAANTGNWSDFATWTGGIVPGNYDFVIANNKTVTINVSVTCVEVRNDTTGSATAGGRFILSNGVTLTANIYAGGTAPTGTGCVQMNLASPNTATITGDIVGGSIANSCGFTQSSSGNTNITGLIIAGSSEIAIYHIGSGTVSITGNCTGTSSYAAWNNTSGTLTITGNCSSRGVYNNGSGTINITGNINGGSSSTSYGLYQSAISTGTVNITGDVTGGSASTGYGVYNNCTGLTTINGTIIHATGSAIYGTGPINVTTNGTTTQYRCAGANGNWSTGATWIGGAVPVAPFVVRANNYTVQVNVSVGGTNCQIRNDNLYGATDSGQYNLSVGGITVTADIYAGGTAPTNNACVRNVLATACYIVGNIYGGTIPQSYGVSNSTGPFYITGNLYGRAGRALNSSSATITGDIIANGSVEAVNGTNIVVIGNINPVSSTGIYYSGVGTITITGNVIGSASSSAIGLVGNNLTNIIINGNLTSASGSSSSNVVMLSGISLTVNGNVYAGTGSGSHSILNNAVSGIITVNGTVIGNEYGAGSTGISAINALYNIGGFCRVKSIQYGSRGMTPILGPVFLDPQLGSKVTMTKTDFTTKDFVLSDELSIVSPANVRLGTSYNQGQLTGTANIPPTACVELGVPVDNTIGTTKLKPADFWNDSNRRISVPKSDKGGVL